MDFLNAEGAKVSQRTQKRKYKKNTEMDKKYKSMLLKLTKIVSSNLILFGFIFSLSSFAPFAKPSRPLRSKIPRLRPKPTHP